MALKWGIISVGLISHDFVNALSTLNTDEHQVIAVAARDLDRAEKFAKRFDIPQFYGNYLDLAKNPDIEIVYIGTLHIEHFNISKLMLEHGKHVLCEKPLCMNEKQTRQLIAFAREKNRFLMEAIWSRCFPSYQYIRDQVDSGKLGAVKTIEIEVGNPNLPNISQKLKKSLGGGTILTIGVYPIQFCQWVYQSAPKSIVASGLLNDDGVDVEIAAEIRYDDDKIAKIKHSFLSLQSNRAKIIGTNGEIQVPIFFAPTSVIDIDGTERTWPLPPAKYNFNFPNSCGLTYEANEVRKCIRTGKIESELISHSDSIQIAHIEDELRKRIGVKYPEDD